MGPPDRRSLGGGVPGHGRPPRHPSQIYEALLEGALAFVILFALARTGALKRPGLIAGAFGSSTAPRESSASSSASPIRGSRTSARGLTMGMVLSAPLIVIGLGLLAGSLSRKGEPR